MPLDQLFEGYRAFRHSSYRRERERHDKLAKGQSPKVIACADSRIDQTLSPSPLALVVSDTSGPR